MVKRIVLWKIKDDQNKQANRHLLREGLLSLKNLVNDIVSLEVGLNYNTSDFDIVFIVAFNDPYALDQFQNHPEFLRIFELSRTISINMFSCDYMPENSDSAMSTSNNQASNPNSAFNNNMNTGINNIKRDTLASSANNSDSSAFSLPYGGGKNTENMPMGFNQNQNNNAYNGYGNSNASKNSVNFTVSEDLNQIKFANTNKETTPFGAPPNTNTPIGIGNNQSWKCTKCGKTNSSFINMCSCGKRKPMDNMNDLSGMTPNKGMIQQPQNAMMINTGLVPKMPANAMGNTMNSPLAGNNMNNNGNVWICPSCGKSNNDFMKICVCGHRKVENNNSNPLPAYTTNTPNLNKPMMPLPKNPSANSVKSPNNNEFFNNFGVGGNGNNPNQRGPMGMQNTGAMPRTPMGNNGTGPIGKIPNNRPGPMGNTGPMGGNGPMNSNPNRPNPMGGTGPMGGNGPMNNNPNRPNPMGGTGPMGGNGPMNNNPNRPNPMGGNNIPPNNRPNNMGGGNASIPPDSWKCPRCGKILGNFVGQCICGQKKPTRTNMHFN